MPDSEAREKVVRLLLDAATGLREHGDGSRAVSLLDEALRYSQAEEQPSLLAAVRASQGVLERTRGNLAVAAERLSEALDLRRGLSDPYGVARALGDLGRVHLEAGRADEATRCLNQAMEMTAPLEPGRTRAEVLEHGGLLHARLGSPERARSCFEESLKVYERLGDALAGKRVRLEIDKLNARGRRVSLDDEVAALERGRLVEALDAEGWNQSRAAKRLGVTETRVRNLMRRYDLRSRNRRGRPRKTVEAPPR